MFVPVVRRTAVPFRTTLPPPVSRLIVSLVLSWRTAPAERSTPEVEPSRPAEPAVATMPAVMVVAPA